MKPADPDDVNPVFFALADPTRREVIRRLSAGGPATVTDLARDLPITRQAVAKHLEALDEAGLIAAEHQGRRTRYQLTPGPLADAMGWMAEVGAEWDERLQALRRHLQQAASKQDPPV
jgi:DNA-binding transcriptional ArsR family regulator